MRWIFGYGSLIFRPAFDYAERRTGYVRGFARRFWQHSTDHRGTPERPGRVVTLIETGDADDECWGVAYRVADEVYDRTIEALDVREQGGYDRRDALIHTAPSKLTAELYIATPDNPNYAGPAPIADIAAVVNRARGPSGHNRDYVLALADALSQLGGDHRSLDAHVHELAELVR